MQPRARRAARKTAAREGGSRQGARRAGSTQGGPGVPTAEVPGTGFRSLAKVPADAVCQLPLQGQGWQHCWHAAQPTRPRPLPGIPSLPGTPPASPAAQASGARPGGCAGSHPRRLLGRAGQAVRYSPREGLERSLSPPTLGTHPHAEQGACCSPAPRGETRGCHGSRPPIPSLSRGTRGLRPPVPANAHLPQVRGEPTTCQRTGNKGKREGEKKKKIKKMGPVSQLWPFMPRAFGPSSKGIGFAEANDDTSTSSGAGSACCWRQATRVKKYCGHLIIDSLFLHYGRAQRPQLRLRPLCTHHTRTHKGRQSQPRRAWPRMGSTTGPGTIAGPGPAGTTVSWQQSPRHQLLGCAKDASSISQSHTCTGV